MQTNDPQLLIERRKLACMCCGLWPQMNRYGKVENEAHHVKTQGSGGGDDWWNILTLCEGCHTLAPHAWHRNKLKFFKKAPHLISYLKLIGWIFIKAEYKLKLIHPAYRDCKKDQKPEWKIPEQALIEINKNNDHTKEDR